MIFQLQISWCKGQNEDPAMLPVFPSCLEKGRVSDLTYPNIIFKAIHMSSNSFSIDLSMRQKRTTGLQNYWKYLAGIYSFLCMNFHIF